MRKVGRAEREGEDWFPEQGGVCVSACGAWWGWRRSGLLRCRGNKTRFINLSGPRKVMEESHVHIIFVGILDSSDAEILLRPCAREHFNSESWILLSEFWLICGLNLLLLFTLFLLKTIAHVYMLKQSTYLIVMIVLSNNHLLSHLELKNWKKAGCEATGVNTALHIKVKSNLNKKIPPSAFADWYLGTRVCFYTVQLVFDMSCGRSAHTFS